MTSKTRADCHFAAGAVEGQLEATALVGEEKRGVGSAAVVPGAKAQFVSDAVAGAHEFGIGPMGLFIGRLAGAAVPGRRQGIGHIGLVGIGGASRPCFGLSAFRKGPLPARILVQGLGQVTAQGIQPGCRQQRQRKGRLRGEPELIEAGFLR